MVGTFATIAGLVLAGWKEQDGDLGVRVLGHGETDNSPVGVIDQVGQSPEPGHGCGHSARLTSTTPAARTIAAKVHMIGKRSSRSPAVRTMLGTRPAPGGTESTESAT